MIKIVEVDRSKSFEGRVHIVLSATPSVDWVEGFFVRFKEKCHGVKAAIGGYTPPQNTGGLGVLRDVDGCDESAQEPENHLIIMCGSEFLGSIADGVKESVFMANSWEEEVFEKKSREEKRISDERGEFEKILNAFSSKLLTLKC